MDFGDLRREEVINYCRDKYGAEAVSRIITFGTLSAKAVIRDVARIMYSEEDDKKLGDKISKTIPTSPKMTLTKALNESPEFRMLYDGDIKVKNIVDMALRLEGLPKNISQHACGLIIAPRPVYEYCPQVFILNEETGILEGTTQFTMGQCEEIGLLKMDFLGLKTMTVLDENVKDINRIYGKNMKISDIPINDPKVYANIAKGKTKGVFQLESTGMTSFMTKLFQDVSASIVRIEKMPLTDKEKDNRMEQLGNELYERLIAGISLYRPGPMDEIPKYLNGMLNPSSITYDTPELEPILNVTYGVLVYQEQVMTTVRELAGFTKGQADLMRKAMGKKIDAILNEYRPYFIYGSGDKLDHYTGKPLDIKGCVDSGIEVKRANIIWDKMEKFAKYAFNKSHAGGYGDIGIRTGWVSCYHPVIFMKANLNSYIINPDKMKPYLSYCYKEGIKMLPPCVNNSEALFKVHGKEEAIRFGLKGIRNVKKISALILEERNENGIFKSYQNFVERMVVNKKLNRKVIEGLIFAGALDSFEGTRRAKISIIGDLLADAKVERKSAVSGQITMFDLAEEQGIEGILESKIIKTPDIEEYDKDYKLAQEREYAGFYITEHPLDDYEDVLNKHNIIDINTLTEEVEEESNIESMEEDEMFGEETTKVNEYLNEKVSIAGIVKEIVTRYDRNGNTFYTFAIEDRTGSLGVVCFNRAKAKNEDKIVEGKKVVLKGVFSVNDFGPQINIESMIDLENAIEFTKSITIEANKNVETARKQWKQLLRYVELNKGGTKIKFIAVDKEFDFPVQLDLNWNTLFQIRKVFGEENCKLNIA